MKKICALTGATGGIGQAIAEQLADKGYQLLLIGRDLDKLRSLSDKLPGEHEWLVTDLTDSNKVNTLCQQLASRNDISLMINNAGVSAFGHFNEQSRDDITQLMYINLTVPMLLSQAVLPQLISNNGHLVNIGSAFGSIGYPCFGSYCASKFGVRGFTEALSREYADMPVTIGYFAPRATATAINSRQVDDMNKALGNQVDEPDVVAKQLMRFIEQKQRRAVVGWPEKLFARVNGVAPELVDKALTKKLKVINEFAM